jgi:hypothetical protein
MRPRTLAGLVLSLTTAAAAQESVNFTLKWLEVVAGTTTPVANPNGIVEPGEAARIAITATILPGIGMPANYPAPPGPGSGTGTIAGFGLMTVDLVAGTQQAPSLGGAGSWTSIVRFPGFAVGSYAPPTHRGAYMHYLQAGQFPLPGTTANSSNPLVNLWRGTWTPADYSERSVAWNLFNIPPTGGPAPGPPPASILIQYGSPQYPQYAGKVVPASFGSTTIPIIPAPASLALLVTFCVGHRRRRTL